MKISELLSSRDKWTQGHYARDKDGLDVHPQSENAVCWCLEGAATVCGVGRDELHNKLIPFLPNGIYGVISFNDSSGD